MIFLFSSSCSGTQFPPAFRHVKRQNRELSSRPCSVFLSFLFFLHDRDVIKRRISISDSIFSLFRFAFHALSEIIHKLKIRAYAAGLTNGKTAAAQRASVIPRIASANKVKLRTILPAEEERVLSYVHFSSP